MTIHVWGSKRYTWNIITIHNLIMHDISHSTPPPPLHPHTCTHTHTHNLATPHLPVPHPVSAPSSHPHPAQKKNPIYITNIRLTITGHFFLLLHLLLMDYSERGQQPRQKHAMSFTMEQVIKKSHGQCYHRNWTFVHAVVTCCCMLLHYAASWTSFENALKWRHKIQNGSGLKGGTEVGGGGGEIQNSTMLWLCYTKWRCNKCTSVSQKTQGVSHKKDSLAMLARSASERV